MEKEITHNMHETISGIPKIELHLHLEGAFTLSTLYRLMQKYGGNPHIGSVEDIKQIFIYDKFEDFIQTWYWKNTFFREGEDFELSAYETLVGLRQQNIVYIEAFFSPWDFEQNGISMEEITESVIRGCENAERDSGIRWKLIADLNRDHGPDQALHRLENIARYRDKGVIGIGLGGNERLHPAAPFADVFREAKALGLRRVAHAGEAAGAESVSSAIIDLDAERIGHGVRAIDSPQLMTMLKESQIPVEVCITSNVMTGAVSSVYEHPVREFLKQGLKVTINTDDPTMFNCTLNDEYFLLLGLLQCPLQDIKRVSFNALDAAFLDNKERAALEELFRDAWDQVPEDLMSQ
jgi:adenosine deaminase